MALVAAVVAVLSLTPQLPMAEPPRMLPRMVPLTCPVGAVTGPDEICDTSDVRLSESGFLFAVDSFGRPILVENEVAVARHELGGPTLYRPDDEIETSSP